MVVIEADGIVEPRALLTSDCGGVESSPAEKARLGARRDRPEPTQLPLEPRKLQAQAFICRDVRIPYLDSDVSYSYPRDTLLLLVTTDSLTHRRLYLRVAARLVATPFPTFRLRHSQSSSDALARCDPRVEQRQAKVPSGLFSIERPLRYGASVAA